MATSEVNVYPSPTVGTQTPTGSNESNGSFGPVLIVLGVILVLVIISVVVGRICNKKKGGHKVKSQGKDKKSKSKSKDKHQTHSHHPGQVQPGGDPADIEFGFDKRFASAKVASGDHGFDFKVPPKVQAYNGGGGGGGGGRGGGGNGGGGGDPGFDFRGQKVQAYNGGAGGGGGGGGDHGFDFRGPKVQAYNGGAGGGHGPRGPHAVRFADEHRVDFRTGA